MNVPESSAPRDHHQAQQPGTTNGVYPRAVLNELPAYVAGKPSGEVPGLRSYKLSSNENPYAPVPAVIDKLAELFSAAPTEDHERPAGEILNRYPDTMYTALRQELGATLDVDPDDIVIGAGSLGALTQLVSTLAGTSADGTRDEVIIPWRSFEAYPIVVLSAGAQDIRVPLLADGRHDLQAMADALTPATRMIMLCSPNNPTGPVLTTAEVDEFMAKVPADVLVVLDEAYVEFIEDPQAVNGLEFFARYPNAAVVRTFSKAHGLANLRIGYALVHPDLMPHVRVMATPFATSTIAETAAITSLQNLDQVHKRVAIVQQQRRWVLSELHAMGIQVPESSANFFWLDLRERTPEFVQKAATWGLSVRGFGQEGVRVTIGEAEANERLLQMVAEFFNVSR
ncbi:histidinol-phosphate transaminase [Auritidibacter sp. NML100628]|uniref:histidinol-phosphate transaminase n=1 Tax=Auritidibacter sp. NML100628 TaxID=2170742 RepID=UPI000D72EDFA|nr:histidinol-phosphate transaminase [Auritidibacter sp. NML100628]PXA78464.1 aminotransferase [Auritidibacter sp. NML100628]